ncbi:asparagine synthase (glutamine-hydrolyzing) [Rhodonellum sp.]|uniref:asparagine synthase (glutamine-hydrolyzing) n=1 Tax=Rhodonellum sp. TaxID=2231180 RepID=UPI0027198578|nr:asparagine synthase (glutamine-hydrolyzing) [Rhodonellum sp.]MDO9551459.1 asparagine synthase (glutamine-hydrolyzing) [Rhodonellum sp.]
MCGIAAILTQDQQKKDTFLERSHQLLRHRGPDSEGDWKDGFVGLVHQRLSIQDLSEAGHQPMVSTNERYIIIFNGEIYNHIELRAKYFPNKNWKGHSDTETILSLFEILGAEMFSLLVGMWAIAIWDTQEKKMLLSRDRYGQKPLYYRFYSNGDFGVASEIKPLLIPGQSNQANSLMVAEYLALGNYGHLGDQTFFAEIFQLLPGSYAWISTTDTSIVSKKYWEIPLTHIKDKIPVGEREITLLKECLYEAVSSQTISDVPIGASLSGGLDSSLVVGILASRTTKNNPISVFTAQTPGSKWDESPYVKAVSDKWGSHINLFAKDLNQVKISESLERTIYIQEEPFGDPSIIAHSFLMDMAKDVGIKVVLGGQGADEVFRGYSHNIKQLFSHELSRLNFSYALPELKKSNYNLQETLRIGLGAYFPQLERSMRMNSREKRRFFLSNELREAAGKFEMSSRLALANNWEASLKESISGVHIPHLVHYDDRNGMARSIEGRMPFLDHRLLDLVSTFSPESFFENGFSKDLIRKAGKEFIPETVFKRKDKLGFFTPIHEMLHSEIDWVKEMVGSPTWVDGKVIQKDIDFYRSSGNSIEISERLWRTVSLACWSNLFNVKL